MEPTHGRRRPSAECPGELPPLPMVVVAASTEEFPTPPDGDSSLSPPGSVFVPHPPALLLSSEGEATMEEEYRLPPPPPQPELPVLSQQEPLGMVHPQQQQKPSTTMYGGAAVVNVDEVASLADGASTFSSKKAFAATRNFNTNNAAATAATNSNSNPTPTILKVNPLESEAEILIRKALEQQSEPKNTAAAGSSSRSRANTGTSTFEHPVPANPNAAASPATSTANHHRRIPSNAEGSTGSRRTAHKPATPTATTTMPPPPRTTTSTEQSLADLTMALEAIHSNNTSNNTTGSAMGADAAVHTAAQVFCHNANLVFHNPRRQSVAADPPTPVAAATIPPPAEPTTTGGSSSHWNVLRHAVVQTAVATSSSSVPPPPQSSLTTEFNNNKENDTDVEGGGMTNARTDEPEYPVAAHEGGGDEGVFAGTANAHLVPPHSASASGGVKKSSVHHLISSTVRPIGADLQLFVGQRRRMFLLYVYFLLFVLIPATAVAVVLFYFADNTPTGRMDRDKSTPGNWIDENGNPMDESKASTSWWILFILVRQALTFSMAHLWQVIIIDFLCLNTKFFQSILGNLLTLLIVQSKGWPFIAVTWGVLDFALLHGSCPFASSWLYWQDVMDVFNDANPGGSVTSNIWNTRVLLIAVSVGLVVGIKRLWLGLFLGKKTYINHADDLQKVYRKIVLLCEVATLARDLQQNPSYRRRATNTFGMSKAEFDSMLCRNAEPGDTVASPEQHNHRFPIFSDKDFGYEDAPPIDHSNSDPDQATLNDSERRNMLELLGAWEEPEAESDAEENVSISAILLFQNLVTIFDKTHMFSLAWGDVSSRDLMIGNSEKVYYWLVLGSSDPDVLKFEVLARIAKRQNGDLNQEKLSDLIRLLRPNRDGNLQLIDFVKSVDSVYKEAKLLRASIRNSGKIDAAFEKSLNVVFYTVIICIILSQIGINPYALFLSLSPLILAFAFMIGSAASKMFEGWLFILIRRPYNIGDLIHISSSEEDTNSNGSSGWVVKDMTLFHTTAVYSSTGEVATLSNGSLAGSRIINMARSPNAAISIGFKFSTRQPFERIQIFDNVLREFVKARPREWSKFSGFRVSQVVADLGYVEYKVLLTHREAWQNLGAIMESKATVASFCLELSKKLDMQFQSPPLPVELAMVSRGSGGAPAVESMASPTWQDGDVGFEQLASLYAKNK